MLSCFFIIHRFFIQFNMENEQDALKEKVLAYIFDRYRIYIGENGNLHFGKAHFTVACFAKDASKFGH